MSSRYQNISIVIPTYRRGEIILETLLDLLALTVRPSEILVVDQTEAPSPEMLQNYQTLERQGIVRRIALDKPSIPHAMNVGLQAAKGDFVLFLDDDVIPDENLIRVHLAAYGKCPEAVAVAGQVLQPEDVGERDEGGSQMTDDRGRRTASGPEGPTHRREVSGLRKDLKFGFNGTTSAWVENVMAGNLSVNKKFALRLGGFDENFIPPVSFRFETEFAKRLVAAGGRIRFVPAASIRHLRASSGGTRSRGSHLTSVSPVHGVGDYYYAMRCGKGLDRIWYLLRRPFREVCTKFHLRHPWWIPVKFVGELRALWLAIHLSRVGFRLDFPVSKGGCC